MNWQQQITNYQPFNEQERQDQHVFLKCIASFDDVLTRNNEIAHVTCSGFVLNKARTHVLMIHHNIYNAWGWTGGHADGEMDFLQVARREVQEETGVHELRALTEQLISLDMLTVMGHVKKGKFISPHIHLNVTYVFEADETATLLMKEDENSGVAWMAIADIAVVCNEPHMIPVYEKIIARVLEEKL